jgi:hypothetical protein
MAGIVQPGHPRYCRFAWSRSQLFSAIMRWPAEASLGILDKHDCNVSSTEPAAIPLVSPEDPEYSPSVAQAPATRTTADKNIHAPDCRIVMGTSL